MARIVRGQMDAVETEAPVCAPIESAPDFGTEFRSYWTKVPDKGFFIALVALWCAVFYLFGISSFNFSKTPSLFEWMRNAWDDPMMDASQGT